VTTAAPSARFFRLFELEPTRFDADFLLALGAAMAQDRMERVPLNIPSGYVYLGQFLAHDLTHQRGGTDLPSVQQSTADALVQLNEPTLELDSVYGPNAAALAPDNPALALARGKFRLGAAGDGRRERPGCDLPRDPQTLEALIADFRNDENLLIGQLHLQFLKLHNFFFDRLQAQTPGASVKELFAAARQQTILHYQMVILYEWLAKVLDDDVWRHLIRDDRQDCGALWDTAKHPAPDMPIEFSFGAMRFGHSMVLPSYNITSTQVMKIEEAFLLTGRGGFKGLRRLPPTHVVDWTLFFGDPLLNPHGPLMNFAMRISDAVVLKVPPHVATGDGRHFHQLAKRNLARSLTAMVPSGQQVVALLRERHGELCRLIALDDQYLAATANCLRADNNPVLGMTLAESGQTAQGEIEVPLWYYVLAEAFAHNGDSVDGNYRNWGRLGKVGSLIIAEVVRTLTRLGSISVYRALPACYDALTRSGCVTRADGNRGGSNKAVSNKVVSDKGEGERIRFSTMLDLLTAVHT